MKIRSQVGMVLNLDKCIGCHTCSVTCKNVWTGREGMEYAWFNNVETKPGIGYPKNWEDQDEWQGGWIRGIHGKLTPRLGGKMGVLSKIFANPVLPQIDDYYEPFTFDYQDLHRAPEGDHLPTARPRSLIDGKRMDKIKWGPNWEELLGGEFEKTRPRSKLSEDPERDVRPVRKHLHDVPAAPVRALPEPELRRHLPERCDLQTRRGRHCADRPGQMPRLASVH
ncbi:Respiratory nitrate reductase beta chain [Enterobacter hormaechei]|nr:Respiratory nitrate reductase beta chain [Enterobacter hormaechei]